MAQVRVLSSPTDLPGRHEVRALYTAAAALPPLSESESSAELYASVYEASIGTEQLICAATRDGGRLVAFAYGHSWLWSEQQYPWALKLKARLGPSASTLDGTHSLNLLARDPGERYRGRGREVLTAWLDAIGTSACWLQTTDIESPARRLYVSLGFELIGHGPDAPNGTPGCVLFRSAP